MPAVTALSGSHCAAVGCYPGLLAGGRFFTVRLVTDLTFVATGSYSVSVSATSQNKLDDILPSKMLVDNITFA